MDVVGGRKWEWITLYGMEGWARRDESLGLRLRLETVLAGLAGETLSLTDVFYSICPRRTYGEGSN